MVQSSIYPENAVVDDNDFDGDDDNDIDGDESCGRLFAKYVLFVLFFWGHTLYDMFDVAQCVGIF